MSSVKCRVSTCFKVAANICHFYHDLYLSTGSEQLMRELNDLQEQRICKVCYDEEINTVFLPCGHLVCCSMCAPALSKCPVCRTSITDPIRVYLSWREWVGWWVVVNLIMYGPLTRYVKLRVAHVLGMPGMFSPPSWRTCHDACRDR